MKHFRLFLLLAAVVPLAVACNKNNQPKDGGTIEGTYSYTNSYDLTLGGQDQGTIKTTGTLTITKLSSNTYLFSVPNEWEAEASVTSSTSAASYFLLDSVKRNDDMHDDTVRFSGATLYDGTLTIIYMINGKWRIDNELKSVRLTGKYIATK